MRDQRRVEVVHYLYPPVYPPEARTMRTTMQTAAQTCPWEGGSALWEPVVRSCLPGMPPYHPDKYCMGYALCAGNSVSGEVCETGASNDPARPSKLCEVSASTSQDRANALALATPYALGFVAWAGQSRWFRSASCRISHGRYASVKPRQTARVT